MRDEADSSELAKSSSIGRRRKHASREPSAIYTERRDQLLAAAAEVIKDRGLDAASLNVIAEHAGTDRANIYYYFGSKQEIFQELIRSTVTENVLFAEEVASSDDTASARMTRLIRGLLGAYERQYPLMHLFLQEDIRKAGAELQQLAQRYESALGKIARDGIASGEFSAGLDPALVVMAVLGAANWTHRWFTPGGRLSGDAIGSAFADIFLTGLTREAER